MNGLSYLLQERKKERKKAAILYTYFMKHFNSQMGFCSVQRTFVTTTIFVPKDIIIKMNLLL